MKFNAQNFNDYDNIILFGGCNSKKLESMYQQTKDVIKYTAFCPNNSDLSDLCAEIKQLKRLKKTEVFQCSKALVIISYENPVYIKKCADELKKIGIAFDHILNYTFNIDLGILNLLGYNQYVDYMGNEISFKGKYSLSKICIYKDKVLFSDKCSKNIIKLGNLHIVDKLSVLLFGKNSEILIGDDTSFINSSIQISTDGKIKIGKDSMFSSGILLSHADQHLIFDLNTKERVNANKNIKIGNHVWVGRNAQLLGGAHIPDNCIIGGNAITSHNFTEKNCIIAGNPAKVIRKNIIWARDNQAYDYQTYDECKDQRALQYLD